jgi:hypothetical protein
MLADHLERVRRQFAWAMSGPQKPGEGLVKSRAAARPAG